MNVESNFSFSERNKPINWERLRSLDLVRLEKRNDVSTLLRFKDDASIGYVPTSG